MAPLTTRTTGALLSRAVESGPHRMAVRLGDQALTYGELDRLVNRTANGLRQLGVTRGDRVAVLMANNVEYLIVYHAVGRLGAVLVPIVTDSKLPEVEYFLEHSETTKLVVDDRRWSRLVEAPGAAGSQALQRLEQVILVAERPADGTISFSDLVSQSSDAPPGEAVGAQDVLVYMYTSGTTGRPKAVIHSHHVAVSQAEAVAERMEYAPDDKLLTIFPLYHGNALTWSALAAVHAGASLTLTERFSASRFWDQVRKYDITEVNLLIGAINMLLAQPPTDRDKDHPLRLILATITQALYDQFTARFGGDIVTTWAHTEGPLGCMSAPGYGYRPGLIGWPMGRDNEVKVVDADDNEVPNGKVGELVARNDAMMLGYLKNESETERVLRGGWVHSGDLGYRDDQGLFYFVGRQKHVIRRSGENVSGEEVEDCLTSHPAVVEAAVIPVPDPIRDEEIKAFIVLAPGASVAEEELVEWTSERLADFKVPRYIEFRPSLPKTGTERVQHQPLRDEENPTACWDRQAAAQRS